MCACLLPAQSSNAAGSAIKQLCPVKVKAAFKYCSHQPVLIRIAFATSKKDVSK
jgi:hypothetical protein